MIGFMYILECVDGSYYTGSTIDIDKRMMEHQAGMGANFTHEKLPVKLVYLEEFDRIDFAFIREKQVKNWSRKKKQALINGDISALKAASTCKNNSHYTNRRT